jgi:hypothetical protein
MLQHRFVPLFKYAGCSNVLLQPNNTLKHEIQIDNLKNVLNHIIYGIKACINKIKNDMSSFHRTKKGGAKCKHFIVFSY